MGPQAKFQRLMVPWKPLPLEVPVTSTLETSEKSATETTSPTLCSSPEATRTSLR